MKEVLVLSKDVIKAIEEKWQKRWEEGRIFEANANPAMPKAFVTFPYPYVNGDGHLGHLYTQLHAEFYARYKRMKGYNVLFPQGFHATGQPIVAAAKRIKEGDVKYMNILKQYGFSEEEIPEFRDPRKWIETFVSRWVEALRSMGFSIDWRRSFYTTELNPPYDRFIRWQYNKLKEKGLVVRGTHPVVWCPVDKIPVGDHDRPDEYAGIGPEEIVVIKFRMDDGTVVPTGTYRPETVYGVTNIWINPKAEYVVAEVDGERWILSEWGARNFAEQTHKVEEIKKIRGEELVGKSVKNPVTGADVPIFPAEFVDPDTATGIVMSVPAHAPYDWIALEDLKRDAETLDKYGIRDVVEGAEPIGLIDVEGYSEFPARDVVEKYGIRSQKDEEALEKATDEIYKKEFYTGKLRDVFGEHAGKSVQEAKELLVKEFLEKNAATTMWITPVPVEDRAGHKCLVKIVENQWFLKYSDPEWKKTTGETLKDTKFDPESDVCKAIKNTIDWLKDWACTRDVRSSLGTRLPWDDSQYIESLSDSTVYMAYYTIAHYLQNADEYGINVDDIDDGLFDYVFYGEGDVEKIGIKREVVEAMRREFEYWYPVDLRSTGKDLLQNHVTFSIFHHAVLFPGKHIRRWSANGWVLLDGQKMSKSSGHFITIIMAKERWGADATRFAGAYAGNMTLEDPNFETEVAEAAVEELIRWREFIKEWYGKGDDEYRDIDRWFESRVNRIIGDANREYEALNTRNVVNTAWFDMWRTVRYYLRRTMNRPNREVLSKALEDWVKIMAPITPHMAEEIWHEVFGKEGFVSLEKFPDADTRKIDSRMEKMEEYVQRVVEDVKEVLRLARIDEPKRAVIIMAEDWKYTALKRIKERLSAGERDMGVLMGEVPPEHRKGAAKLIASAIKNPKKIPEVIGSKDEEMGALREAKEFIEGEVKIQVEVAEDYDHPKARNALPFKPAIVVE